MTLLKSLLAHPLTRGLDIDSPETTLLRQRIIQEKPFLKQIYQEWYHQLTSALEGIQDGPVLELGSGCGFLKSYIPHLITSDVLPIPKIDVTLIGQALPFQSQTLTAIVMTNVLHHISQPRAFFSEAARCIKPNGRLVMVEPWVTSWSWLVYARLHHEPFEPAAENWSFPNDGPLSSANGALPWIIFQRDRETFDTDFPQWQLEIVPFMPFRYLISGGVSLRNLSPDWMFNTWRWLEDRLQPWVDYLAMFARITLVKAT